MAIVFNTDISETDLLLAYNNNIIEYYSDSITPSIKSIITLGTDSKIIYPSPSGVFYFNFLEWVKSLINVDNFKDDLNVDIDLNGYIYNWASKILLQSNLTIQVWFDTEAYEETTKSTTWLSALLQLEDYKLKYPLTLTKQHILVLSNFKTASNQSAYLKYWFGYPFDIQLYDGAGDYILLENQSNLLNVTLVNTSKCPRLVVSDGNITNSLETEIALLNGLNRLKFTNDYGYTYFLDLEKIDSELCGTYIKWFNNFGGWNYWLFSDSDRTRQTKDLGEINSDFYNLGNSISPTTQIGTTAKDTLQVTTDVINENDALILDSLFDSPKIYLFTGQPLADNNFNNWIEISLKSNNILIKKAMRKNNILNLSFELPQRFTRTI